MSSSEQIAKPWRTGNDETIRGRMKGEVNASSASAEGALAEIKLIEVELEKLNPKTEEVGDSKVIKREVNDEIQVDVEVDLKVDSHHKHI